MSKALIEFFKKNNDHRKLALKDKLQGIKMQKIDIIPQYLIKFTQCRDELGRVDVNVPEEDLVRLSLLVFPKSWHKYQDLVNGREKLLNWERLWFDLVHEEIRQNTRDGTSSKGEDERKNCIS